MSRTDGADAPTAGGDEQRLVFLAGLHRSGTSPLFRILREHPSISGFRDTGVEEDEGQLLQQVYPPGRAHGGPGLFALDPAAHLDEGSPLATDENAARLFGQWSKHWQLDRPVLLEKSPPNLVRTRFLQRLFPCASFVVIVRHPLAVAYATLKWSHTSVGSLIEHWLVAHERFMSDRARLARVLVLKYESFVARPVETLGRIHEFIGVEPVAHESEVRTRINDRYFGRWRRRRAKLLAGAHCRYLGWKFEARVRRFGYSLRDLDRDEDIEP